MIWRLLAVMKTMRNVDLFSGAIIYMIDNLIAIDNLVANIAAFHRPHFSICQSWLTSSAYFSETVSIAVSQYIGIVDKSKDSFLLFRRLIWRGGCSVGLSDYDKLR